MTWTVPLAVCVCVMWINVFVCVCMCGCGCMFKSLCACVYIYVCVSVRDQNAYSTSSGSGMNTFLSYPFVSLSILLEKLFFFLVYSCWTKHDFTCIIVNRSHQMKSSNLLDWTRCYFFFHMLVKYLLCDWLWMKQTQLCSQTGPVAYLTTWDYSLWHCHVL